MVNKFLIIILILFIFLLPQKLFSYYNNCRKLFKNRYNDYHFYKTECSKNVFNILELYEKNGISLDNINVILILFDKRKTLYGVSKQPLKPARPRERWRSESWMVHAVIEIFDEFGKTSIFDMDFSLQKQLSTKEYFERMFGNDYKIKFEGNVLDRIHIRSIPANLFLITSRKLKSPVEAILRFKRKNMFIDTLYPIKSVRQYLGINGKTQD